MTNGEMNRFREAEPVEEVDIGTDDESAGNLFDQSRKATSDAVRSTAGWFNALLATDFAAQLDRWMRDNLTSDSTIYDRAMDASYAASGEGGMLHRLIDGSHDLVGAWQAVSSASETDTLTQEVAGYLAAIWNDLATPMGIPIVSLDKDAFDAASVEINEALGISKTGLADALSVTATELLGASIGGLALCLSWNEEDVAAVSKLAGALIPTTVLAGNPLLVIVAVVALARSYQKAKKAGDFKAAFAGLGQGSVGSLAFIGAASVVSGPAWVTILVGVVAFIAASKFAERAGQEVGKVNWSELAAWISAWFRNKNKSDKTPAVLLLPSP